MVKVGHKQQVQYKAASFDFRSQKDVKSRSLSLRSKVVDKIFQEELLYDQLPFLLKSFIIHLVMF